ncbi:MAG: PQQ-binding-like beta-propeller repeat protein [Candidatus Marsarchaeota archaeon]|nr:PQQ-binding-like beta-propeller repeat protein [Candidatus Marsarchaeota archaeon]
MRNLKGFIFTVDSLFALVVAVAAVSILLIAVYTPAPVISAHSGEALSVAQSFLETSISQEASQGIPFAAFIYGSSSSYTWPQYGNNESIQSSTPGPGPSLPLILFNYTVDSPINPEPAVADGMVAFTTNAPNSQLYALNATTGALIFNTPVGGPFIGPPVMYDRLIYSGNTMGYVNAYTESGSLAWSTKLQTSVNYFDLQELNGYLFANGTVMYPSNGVILGVEPSVLSNTNGAVAADFYNAYSKGIYTAWLTGYSSVKWVNSWSYKADYGELMASYSIYGNTITPLRYCDIYVQSGTRTITQPPAIGYNTIAADDIGAYLGIYSLNSSYYAGPSKIQGSDCEAGFEAGWSTYGSPSIYKSVAYLQMPSNIAAYNISSQKILYVANTPNDNSYNITPSSTQKILYTMDAGNMFRGYNRETGNLLWNITIPSQPYKSYLGDIAVAYGNAYFAVGNTLYASGSPCHVNPNDNILHALATMYLNGAGGCAAELLRQSYNSSNLGLYINNTYAPSTSVATFDGSTSYIWGNDTYSFPLSNFEWIYPTAYKNYLNMNPIIALDGYSGRYEGEYGLFLGTTGITGSENGNLIVGNGNGALVSNFIVPLNQWSLVGFYLDGSKAIAYYDGQQQVFTSNTKAVSPLSSNWIIGGVPCFLVGGGCAVYQGYMSDIQVYNSLISNASITQLYENGLASPPTSANIVNWWPLEGDTNDYVSYAYGAANDMAYTSLNYTPLSLQQAYQVSRASIPMTINVHGTNINYNVGVVIWK